MRIRYLLLPLLLAFPAAACSPDGDAAVSAVRNRPLMARWLSENPSGENGSEFGCWDSETDGNSGWTVVLNELVADPETGNRRLERYEWSVDPAALPARIVALNDNARKIEEAVAEMAKEGSEFLALAAVQERKTRTGRSLVLLLNGERRESLAENNGRTEHSKWSARRTEGAKWEVRLHEVHASGGDARRTFRELKWEVDLGHDPAAVSPANDGAREIEVLLGNDVVPPVPTGLRGFWTWTFLLGIVSFYILVFTIIPLGFRDLKLLFRDLKAEADEEAEAEASASASVES